MPRIRTNRDLYLFVADLISRAGEDAPTLAEFLKRLLVGSRRYCNRPGISPDEFAGLLELALLGGGTEAPAATLDMEANAEFKEWEEHICLMLLDLDTMRRDGDLDRPDRYFGITSRNGMRWFNLDALPFVECGSEGTFGGWQPGDDTGRRLVPGKVMVTNASGEMVLKDPQDVPNPIYDLAEMTWSKLTDFLWNGQYYE